MEENSDDNEKIYFNVSLAVTSESTGELETVGIKKQIVRERDMVCLSLDGFRKAARLCCSLGKRLGVLKKRPD